MTVVDLDTFTVTDNALAVSGTGKNPGSIVYDNRDNHIYYFQTDYCEFGYCQRVIAFKITNAKKLNAVANDPFSPNYRNGWNKGACKNCALDTANNNIWCINDGTNQLVKFPLANMNNAVTYDLPGMHKFFVILQ